MDECEIPLQEALHLLAVMGDLSMGQAIDHSTRVAALASSFAAALGSDQARVEEVRQIALLRWVGCTANATDVAEIISDDVEGRSAMLALELEKIELLTPLSTLLQKITTTTEIHCEVASVIAQTLGLSPSIMGSLNCLFENWDGTGAPNGVHGDAIPFPAMLVAIAGDLEIFTRVYGPDNALKLLVQRADANYPRHLVDMACRHAETWLHKLSQANENPARPAPQGEGKIGLSLIADVIDLKLPWLTGHSRAVANQVADIAARLNLSSEMQGMTASAGLLHGLGRVTVPNATWNQTHALSTMQWERVRLGPYWTARSIAQIKQLAEVAEISSYAFERLDGSGYFRGNRKHATALECRILPVVTAWQALRSKRPWRDAFTAEEAREQILSEVDVGRFDREIVEMLDPKEHANKTSNPRSNPLTPREIDVLRKIGLGNSNKETALALGISPATVRTHVENLFRKLECKSRAAAILKASTLNLI